GWSPEPARWAATPRWTCAPPRAATAIVCGPGSVRSLPLRTLPKPASAGLEGDDASHPLSAGRAAGGVAARGGGHLIGGVEEVRGDGEDRQAGPAAGPGRRLPRLDADHADEDVGGLGGGRSRAGGEGCRGPG